MTDVDANRELNRKPRTMASEDLSLPSSMCMVIKRLDKKDAASMYLDVSVTLIIRVKITGY